MIPTTCLYDLCDWLCQCGRFDNAGEILKAALLRRSIHYTDDAFVRFICDHGTFIDYVLIKNWKTS